MKIEVSNGEILDKLSILELKLKYIDDKKKRDNLKREYKEIKESATQINVPQELYDSLYATNELLWEIEDDIREKERKKQFDVDFIELARAVYKTNDIRSTIKKQINLATNSQLIEEKSYKDHF